MNQLDGQRVREIVARHGAALALYARQWCRWPDDAVQEALIELVGLPEWPPNPTAWLFRAVRWRAMNLARAERRRTEHQQHWSEAREAWFIESSDTALEGYEAQKMLEQLNETDREIVVARIWGELSFEQIAELVELSTSTVHRRYGQTLERLAALMEGEVTPSELM